MLSVHDDFFVGVVIAAVLVLLGLFLFCLSASGRVYLCNRREDQFNGSTRRATYDETFVGFHRRGTLRAERSQRGEVERAKSPLHVVHEMEIS